MLRATGIQKSYNQLKVLKSIDLEISKGEIVAIVGASGAGKSTLLHILGTLDTPEQGKVIINNVDVFSQSSKNLAAFRNKSIGFVFLNSSIVFNVFALGSNNRTISSVTSTASTSGPA